VTRKHAPAVDSSPLPHSWDFSSWPTFVYPGNGKRGKYLYREHQRELLAEGACTRIGRTLVFFGAGYGKFLKKRAVLVPDFNIAANTKPPAAADQPAA